MTNYETTNRYILEPELLQWWQVVLNYSSQKKGYTIKISEYMKPIKLEFLFYFSSLRQFKKIDIRGVVFVNVVFLLLSGCVPVTYLNKTTPQYTTSVSSFGNYNLVGKSFYIESGDINVSSTDVEFKEYAKYIANTLTLQGAKETTDKKHADMCILVNYSISDKSYTETVPIPIWGQTGISSISTKSNSYGTSFGSATKTGNSAYGSVQSNSTTKTTTRVNPTYGVTGYANVDRRVVQHCRILNIYSYDNKQTREPIMLWKTNLLSNGTSSDFRNVLPYMVYSAWGKMGTSSGSAIDVTIMEEDYFFRCWKLGILNQSNVTSFPKINKTNVPSFIQIAIVAKANDETIIVLRKSGCPSWYGIASNTYIEHNGKKFFIESVDNYTLGEKIRKECGVRYFRLHFPPIPDNVQDINIKENVENGWEWNGVSLR
jgi:hypothetical protein